MSIDKPIYNSNVSFTGTEQKNTVDVRSIDDIYNYDFLIRRSDEEKRKYDAMKKAEKQKMAIEKLTKYCGKKSGKYQVPEEMLTEGKTTMPGEISVVGGPGEPGGVVLFKIPYRKFEGSLPIFCVWDMKSKEPMRNRYTPANEKKIITNNIRILYQEDITVGYQDCRRKMRGAEIGGEIHWVPIDPGSNGDIWNTEICSRLEK